MKRGFLLVSLFLFAFVLGGCDLLKPSEKTFSGAGVTITLDESFVEEEVMYAPFYLESKDHIFMAVRESKVDLNAYNINTLGSYIQAVLDASNKTATIKTYDEDGITYKYAYYTSTVEDQTFGYMLLVMEGDNHFYSMNFGCLESNLEDNKDQYFEWAKTITVD